MSEVELGEAFGDAMREAWHRYIDLLNPIRPDLYGYCRRLTGNVWDAEDLVQDALMRAFAKLGQNHPAVENPKAYLFRTATHIWIDAVRRRAVEAAHEGAAEAPQPPHQPPVELRDAGAALLERLSPQERASLVLKEGFGLTLEETAHVLQTSVGAVKSALNRGRGHLREAELPAGRPAASVALIDRFVAAYNAADLPGLVKLLLEDASVEQLGCAESSGRQALEEGFLTKAVYGHPEWPEAFQYESTRLERIEFRGEPIALGWVTRHGREKVEQVMRFAEVEGAVARIRTYAFCPEAMRELGDTLGVPIRTGLYRYPTPAPGQSYDG